MYLIWAASSPSPSLLRKSTSPKGRGLGKEMKSAWTAKGSPFEERLPPRRGKMSRSDKRGNLANVCEPERASLFA
ncbi:hypothetical protein DW937_05360 [Faecalibacterium sp. AM43-5AT]|nr:hypothetical protein DW937_05360 [Faecalibacterium sp. AM43-5AT]